MAARKFGMHSLHVKNNTAGTSNEISLSVLDAKKQQKDAASSSAHDARPNPLGKVALFSLSGKKKVKGAPQREEGLPLASGDFAPSAAEHDPTGKVSLGSNAISGGTIATGFTEDFSGSAPAAKTGKQGLRGGFSRGNSAAPRERTPEEKAQSAKRIRRAGVATLACVIIAAAAFGVYSLAHNYYEMYLLNQSYQQVLTSSLAEVVAADEILTEMDATFTDMLGENSLAAMKAVKDKLPTASQDLDKAQSLVQRVQGNLSDAKDVEAAKNTLDTIEARRVMLSSGSAMIDEALNVAQACDDLSAAWDKMLSADTLARRAVSSVSPLDQAAVAQAKTTAEQARSAFEEAQTQLAEVKKAHPDLPLSDYQAYVTLRITALDHLIAACEAIEVEDVDLAASESDAYNTTDAQAVALASGFAADISTLATQPFFSAVEKFKETYDAAMNEAATLDAALREYLRTTSSQ